MKTLVISTKQILSLVILAQFTLGTVAKAEYTGAVERYNVGREEKIESLAQIEKRIKDAKAKPASDVISDEDLAARFDEESRAFTDSLEQAEKLRKLRGLQETIRRSKATVGMMLGKQYTEIKSRNEADEKKLAALGVPAGFNPNASELLEKGEEACYAKSAELLNSAEELAKGNVDKVFSVRSKETAGDLAERQAKNEADELKALKNRLAQLKDLAKFDKAKAKETKLPVSLDKKIALAEKDAEDAQNEIDEQGLKNHIARKKLKKADEKFAPIKHAWVRDLISVTNILTKDAEKSAKAAKKACEAQKEKLGDLKNPNSLLAQVVDVAGKFAGNTPETQKWFANLQKQTKLECPDESKAVKAIGKGLVAQAESLEQINDQGAFLEGANTFVKATLSAGVRKMGTTIAKSDSSLDNCNIFKDKVDLAKDFLAYHGGATAMGGPAGAAMGMPQAARNGRGAQPQMAVSAPAESTQNHN